MQGRLKLKAVIYAALAAGIVFVVAEMILVGTIGGKSPFGPPRMMAALAMGKGVLPPPASFDPGIFVTGMIVHFILSFVLALILGFVISRGNMGRGSALVTGLVFGAIVYVVDFYVLTAVFPWFVMARTPVTIATHLMFGLVAAWVYHAVAMRAPA